MVHSLGGIIVKDVSSPNLMFLGVEPGFVHLFRSFPFVLSFTMIRVGKMFVLSLGLKDQLFQHHPWLQFEPPICMVANFSD